MTDSEEEFLTIGAFARSSGLTPSALRFYDDCALLVPAFIDAKSGYRYYTRAQAKRANIIRQLREIGMSLDKVASALDGDGAAAVDIVDRHVDELAARARAAAEAAVSIRRLFDEKYCTATVSAAEFASAVEQVASAAGTSEEFPVLRGVLVEVDGGTVTLTATDRYRLSTRSLVAQCSAGTSWSRVAAIGSLGTVTTTGTLALTATDDSMVIDSDGARAAVDPVDGEFPDWRTIMDGLAPTVTRVVLQRDFVPLGGGTLRIEAGPNGVRVDGVAVPAQVTGSESVVFFDAAVLQAAVASAVGPDLMLDIAAPDHSMLVRSAVDGALTTLVMPVLG
ncbi:MAG: MerR family transcriptional regulator [Rhodococcus sp. (in: high G+C Gram-positive bacteria)]|uniref:DNA polymerase III subunit beta family protein n=1 Tax=Rhodococcus sp. SBT000017 TaxID=1803385 RepID=UPI000EF955C6|nr:MerR family transcriptional regulator [Rhodococcus sp. SBT000017]RMB76449.1 MerR family transcriptional regulator [Rhodococcus sp. SBT000017]